MVVPIPLSYPGSFLEHCCFNIVNMYFLQALDLQNYIASMTVKTEDNETVQLRDICFQPLAPQKQECAIQSFFQYFQNNKTRLNKCISLMGYECDKKPSFDVNAYDYHDHVLFCTG